MAESFPNPFQLEVEDLGSDYREAFDRFLNSGWYVLGEEVRSFEHEFAEWLDASGAKPSDQRSIAIGCASGLDALILSLMALEIGPGDEVITTPLSAVATALAITRVGATPVFVDVDAQTLSIDPTKIKEVITNKTKAIIPVHLYGYPADLGSLQKICEDHRLDLIEDCAQGIGTMIDGRHCGTTGNISCFSFYPTKNLGAFGDAGAIVTQSEELAEKLRGLRNYGETSKYHHQYFGLNSRLDELQAALLRKKIPHLNRWNASRQEIAQLYSQSLTPATWNLPEVQSGNQCSFHLFPIQVDDQKSVVAHLRGEGIPAQIHYPTAIPDQPCYQNFKNSFRATDLPHAREACARLVSLPISPYLKKGQIQDVINILQSIVP